MFRSRLRRILFAWVCLQVALVPAVAVAGEIFPCPAGWCELVGDSGPGLSPWMAIFAVPFLLQTLDGCAAESPPSLEPGSLG